MCCHESKILSRILSGMALILIGMSICLIQPSKVMAESQVEGVEINFNNVDINVFIKFISKLTKKNFVVDNRIKGKVTIFSPKKMSDQEAYKVFESVLDIHGYSVVEFGNVTKIVPAANAKTDNVDTRVSKGFEAPADKIVTRIIPLQYASSDELKTLLTPLSPKGSVVLSYRDTNMLIVTATLSSIKRLLKIVKTIDIESIGRKISVIAIKHADAKKMVANLSKIYSARERASKSKSGKNQMVKFVHDERTNSIILLASELEISRIRRLVDILDKKVAKGEEKIRVYYLEHATAEDLAKVLQEIPSKGNSKHGGKKKAPLLSNDIKITADKATNSLIIIADKEDYPVLEAVISKLDIPRAMVYIECLIMEVNADKSLNLGTEWRVSDGFDGNDGVVFGGFGATGDSGYANSNNASSSGTLAKGFSVGVLGDNITVGGVTFPTIQAVIAAYRSDKDVHILSTPQILTTENKAATIVVGKNVPYQTRSAADSGTETYSSYEYKDVGITLKITPSISQDRLVRLSVYQKVERLDSSAAQSSSERPSTLKREIDTTIIVEDSNTVVIGGLIDQSLTQTVGKTPCLGDLPGFGYLFKHDSTGGERTNLYVFLKPRVVKNPMEASKIYKEKREDINNKRQEDIKLYDDKQQKSLLID